jgi:hypothetical protein
LKRNYVEEETCVARRETINEKVDGLKRTIYTSAAAMTIVIVVAEFMFTYLRG